MLKLPFYKEDSIKLALEFGVTLSETAESVDRELTSEIVERAEKIFINEMKTNGYEKTAMNFVPLILASLEV